MVCAQDNSGVKKVRAGGFEFKIMNKNSKTPTKLSAR